MSDEALDDLLGDVDIEAAIAASGRCTQGVASGCGGREGGAARTTTAAAAAADDDGDDDDLFGSLDVDAAIAASGRDPTQLPAAPQAAPVLAPRPESPDLDQTADGSDNDDLEFDEGEARKVGGDAGLRQRGGSAGGGGDGAGGSAAAAVLEESAAAAGEPFATAPVVRCAEVKSSLARAESVPGEDAADGLKQKKTSAPASGVPDDDMIDDLDDDDDFADF
jgi:hypothetical protein